MLGAHEMHETHERIHGAGHGAGQHGHHGPGRNRMIAILISVLAALLALVDIGASSSQTEAIAANIRANDLWAFFQAKTIRGTLMATAADALAAEQPPAGSPAAKQIAAWRATAARYQSEPETGEGRKELAARAKEAEKRRDHILAAYHLYEYGAGALQIAIVLASSAVVTGVIALAWGACGLGLLGTAVALVGWLAPHLLHF
jgi:hypothetical protein